MAVNNRVLELIAEANDKLGGNYIFDRQYIRSICREITELTQKLIYNLDLIAPNKYSALNNAFSQTQREIEDILAGRKGVSVKDLILPYSRIGRDFVEVVGGKNANLAQLNTFLGVRIPPGFAITTAAFYAFLEHNNLPTRIKEITASWEQGNMSLGRAASTIQGLIRSGRLPDRLKKDIGNALEELASGIPGKKIHLAVRSSAIGEDGEYTFAGQYLSLLNVSGADFADWYLRVLASTYGERAMEYRRSKGINEDEAAMAVACQVMVDAKASGVLYSLDPLSPKKERILISSTWGLGAPIVSGKIRGDRFIVDRQSPYGISEIRVVRKESRLGLSEQGGTSSYTVSRDLQTLPSITERQIEELAEIGLLTEKYFRKPQDIEFSVDQDDEIVILQSRQLNIMPHSALPSGETLAKVIENCQILFQDHGEVAQKGIGAGKVFLARDEGDLENFPAGAILVTKYASPLFSKVIAKASGILTDVGSAVGHMATIAREFRVPAILNTGAATQLLSDGMEITIDADDNVVYQGIIKELQNYSLSEKAIETSSEYRLLHRVLKKIEPLHLLDPTAKNFAPASCRTLHDIVRFVHEKAVEELIELNYGRNYDLRDKAVRLEWGIPLDLVLIDIGGGLRAGAAESKVTPEQILSDPMKSLLKGLSCPGAWDGSPLSLDFGSFMSSLTKTFSTELADPKYTGLNLAVVSEEYANVSLRLGYHYTVIDAYLSENVIDNYVYFRFFGGVTDEERRSRRAKLLGKILQNHDFRIKQQGDLVVARIKRFESQSMRERLYLLGLLVGFSRQLDVKMSSEQRVNDYVEKFNTLLGEGYERQ